MKNKLLKLISLVTITTSIPTVLTSCSQTQEYKVTFDSMGGSEVKEVTTINAKVTEPTIPTKQGYTFLGWYKDNKFVYKFNFDHQIMSNITLYAKWSKNTIVNEEEWNNAFNIITKTGEQHNFKLVRYITNQFRSTVIPFWIQNRQFKIISVGGQEYYQMHSNDGNCNYVAQTAGFGKVEIINPDTIVPSDDTGLSNYLHFLFQLQNYFNLAIFNGQENCYYVKVPEELYPYRIVFNEDKIITQITEIDGRWEFQDYGQINIQQWPTVQNLFPTIKVESQNELKSNTETVEITPSQEIYYTIDLSKLDGTTIDTSKIIMDLYVAHGTVPEFHKGDLRTKGADCLVFLNGTNITSKLIFDDNLDIKIDPSVTLTKNDRLVFRFVNSLRESVSSAYIDFKLNA